MYGRIGRYFFWQMLNEIARSLGLRPPQPDRFRGCADQIPNSEKNSSDMHRAFYGNTGPVVNKWRNYLEVYDRHLSKFKNTGVRLWPEIWSIRPGGGGQLWRQ